MMLILEKNVDWFFFRKPKTENRKLSGVNINAQKLKICCDLGFLLLVIAARCYPGAAPR